jgi:S-formylglutathione hydrolase FrmB
MSPRRLAAPVLLLLACLVAPRLAPAQDAPRSTPAGIKTVSFEAPSVGRTLKYNVALPKSYEESPERRYPVLYLLHGFTSDYTAWAFLGAGRAAAPYDLIVVMVDAGNSWYVNWAKTEGDGKNAWEDYLVKDLIGHVDATYRTVARREGRAINGLSMGGYGAMTVGLRHPELFASVGSNSGAIGFAKVIADRMRAGEPMRRPGREPRDIPNPLIGVPDFDSQAERTPKGELFTTAEEADAHDPFTLVAKLDREALPHLYFDCGTEDFLYEGNRDFARLLLEKKVPFTFAQSPGGHTPAYWTREVVNSVAAQYAALTRSLATIQDEKPAD